MEKNWYNKSKEEVFNEFGITADKGLTNEQVEKSLGTEASEEEYQRNENFKEAVSSIENLTEGVQPHAEENNQGESED